jgi:hypothetical protein
VFSILGIKPEEIAQKFEEVLKNLDGRMGCLEDRLAAIQRVLEYEYGRPRREVAGHDPARLPLIAQLEAAGEAKRVDVAGLLGKPATRGHVVNIGDAKAALWFETGAQRVGPYYLLPAAALDLSWALEILEVGDAGEGPAKLQILMQ